MELVWVCGRMLLIERVGVVKGVREKACMFMAQHCYLCVCSSSGCMSLRVDACVFESLQDRYVHLFKQYLVTNNLTAFFFLLLFFLLC